MINVTKSFLPPIEEYQKYLTGIWERVHLTNHGPLVFELEEKLKNYLGVKHLFFINNGTVAIQIAIKAAGLKNDVITTPFSYVATTSSLVWENCNPVFVDIDPDTLCINPDLIEKSITKSTTGILATHVYGNACYVDEIGKIAAKHNLKVIYDAAHAFGVDVNAKSVLNHGDISTLSFHATKIFHTVEGGAVITENDDLAHKISYMRNFGHNGPENFYGIGINGKSSEFHAAMGLCVLNHFEQIKERRKQISSLYDELFKKSDIVRPSPLKNQTYNFSYFPVLFKTEENLLRVKAALNVHNIYPRRYFYPSLNQLDYVTNKPCPVSENVSSRVLCLPLYYELKDEEVRMIAKIIKESL